MKAVPRTTRHDILREIKLNGGASQAALNEPRLYSATLSTMKRLLGVQVERTERFQCGDGRCVFRIRADRPVSKRFRFQWEDDM